MRERMRGRGMYSLLTHTKEDHRTNYEPFYRKMKIACRRRRRHRRQLHCRIFFWRHERFVWDALVSFSFSLLGNSLLSSLLEFTPSSYYGRPRMRHKYMTIITITTTTSCSSSSGYCGDSWSSKNTQQPLIENIKIGRVDRKLEQEWEIMWAKLKDIHQYITK